MDQPNSIGDWLRRELDSRDWNQADLARRVGLNTGTVAHWVTGNRTPSSQMVRRIADALNADVDYLLTLAGHRPPDPYFDPDSPEARLLPYIRQIEWTERDLGAIIAQLEFLIKVQRGDLDRK
jgi:transcriptional regulator with XRE-family HTH domain